MAAYFPSPAVRAYQRAIAGWERKSEASRSLDEIKFWYARLDEQIDRITADYGVTRGEVAQAWLRWVDAVDAARAAEQVEA